MMWLSLCCLGLVALAPWALAEEDGMGGPLEGEGLTNTQVAAEESGGWRAGLWALSMLGFYGYCILASGTEPPEGQEEEAEVIDDDAGPDRTPNLPRHGCAVRRTLDSLDKMEKDIVSLIYQLRKHQGALASGRFAEDRASGVAHRGLPLDNWVCYTIQEES